MTDWPVELRGVTESVVTTLGPNERYNVAALGIHAPSADESCDGERGADSDATARTWGRTRTRRNFEARGEGYVQFVRDPVVFVDAALTIREVEEPVLDGADAWVRVRAERIDAGQTGDTGWVDWRLVPVESEVRRRVVPAFNRGYAAVVEATVAASRLTVGSYDTEELRARIAYFERVAARCGGSEERAAFERLYDVVDERDQADDAFAERNREDDAFAERNREDDAFAERNREDDAFAERNQDDAFAERDQEDET